MAKIYITRQIPESGLALLKKEGHEVVVSKKDGVLTREELVSELEKYNPDAVLCLLTDKIDSEVFDAAPNAKIFANYAVGFNNINLEDADAKGVTVTNTPGVLTDTVAEHTVTLMCALAKRVVEADSFVRAGKYEGWGPMMFLGSDLKGKTLGVLGAGRIGTRVAEIAHNGFGMSVIYYDIKHSEYIEKGASAEFRETPEEVLKDADFVTMHVPLLDSTTHLINKERLEMMKTSAYLVNTSRGPVIDEVALVNALKNKKIRGAALDVFENEPKLAEGLSDLDNVIITPHIASATDETRGKMSEIVAQNIIAFLKGEEPLNKVDSE
ncbi:D-glycerate dehydrogenase [Candidatus Kaiserbacteria bacterium CG10_big_fil_rev_8_21_14_0_10_43_70]|uniref:D-glycerate dehydrogenase n=1 Tax=Candidatus Kaiserbacteria bacterium CG10_big_fil_rev_8_21_14_0_10_43_70 TaxID=1974605 RepID=A0A2H0UJ89_9BACT|nr:MAG: D-glycerate dehydrogenase [Candidatus Kaiserbacteria bacterium CG10_big_fil_rev_8_21_14_0_10_43_70]